ncbi:MAG: hypothetical protein AAGG56_14535 [Pseudomonadota bacterium]
MSMIASAPGWADGMATGPETHSQIVAVLKVTFPVLAVAILLSLFFFAPSDDQQAEIVFTEADLAQLGQGMRITNPTFSGMTQGGDNFRFEADLVEPDAAPPSRATITRLRGEIYFDASIRIDVSADAGDLSIPDQTLDLAGSVFVQAPDGFDLSAEQLSVDLALGALAGQGDVVGTGPMGRITSETLEVTPSPMGEGNRLFSFGNGVRLVYDPSADPFTRPDREAADPADETSTEQP